MHPQPLLSGLKVVSSYLLLLLSAVCMFFFCTISLRCVYSCTSVDIHGHMAGYPYCVEYHAISTRFTITLDN